MNTSSATPITISATVAPVGKAVKRKIHKLHTLLCTVMIILPIPVDSATAVGVTYTVIVGLKSAVKV